MQQLRSVQENIQLPFIISEISTSHGLVNYAPCHGQRRNKPMNLTRTIYNRHVYDRLWVWRLETRAPQTLPATSRSFLKSNQLSWQLLQRCSHEWPDAPRVDWKKQRRFLSFWELERPTSFMSGMILFTVVTKMMQMYILRFTIKKHQMIGKYMIRRYIFFHPSWEGRY